MRRSIAIENPAHYLTMNGHEWDETDFLAELARRTGCGLLLDVNNVYVSARNLEYSAAACVDALLANFPVVARLVGEALAGTALHPHPAARWAWFSDLPIFTIWSRNRANGNHDADLARLMSTLLAAGAFSR
jgi:uncharacterized protein DUF692